MGTTRNDPLCDLALSIPLSVAAGIGSHQRAYRLGNIEPAERGTFGLMGFRIEIFDNMTNRFSNRNQLTNRNPLLSCVRYLPVYVLRKGWESRRR